MDMVPEKDTPRAFAKDAFCPMMCRTVVEWRDIGYVLRYVKIGLATG